MSRNTLICIIGILTLSMPFLGFPSSWKTFFYVCAGILLVILSVRAHMKRRTAEVYSEHRQFSGEL